jgi:hypothetical protein
MLRRLVGVLGRGSQAPPLDIAWLTPALALGVAPAARRLREIKDLGLTSVLDLRTTEERSRDLHWDTAAVSSQIAVETLSLTDPAAPTVRQLEQGSAWVLESLAADKRVLICSQDVDGRNLTFATAVLIRMGYALDEARALVGLCRSAVELTEPQLAALRAFSRRRQNKGRTTRSAV